MRYEDRHAVQEALPVILEALKTGPKSLIDIGKLFPKVKNLSLFVEDVIDCLIRKGIGVSGDILAGPYEIIEGEKAVNDEVELLRDLSRRYFVRANSLQRLLMRIVNRPCDKCGKAPRRPRGNLCWECEESAEKQGVENECQETNERSSS